MRSSNSYFSRKSQSAMEYLITYGWAILIIAVALAVLYQLGVFSGGSLTPRAQPGSCSVERLLGQVSLEGQCDGQLPKFVAQFNGQTSYIIGVTTSGATSGITISAWVELFSPITQEEILARWPTSGPTSDLLEPQSSGAVRLNIAAMTTGTNINTGSVDMAAGKWYNVVGVYSVATGNSIIYVDGIQEGSGTGGAGTFNDISYPWYIGALGTTDTRVLLGDIANVQIYNASLSSSEANELYDEGIGGAPVRLQNIAAWYPLNGNADDYSGNNNNGQMSGGVVFNSTWSSSYTPP